MQAVNRELSNQRFRKDIDNINWDNYSVIEESQKLSELKDKRFRTNIYFIFCPELNRVKIGQSDKVLKRFRYLNSISVSDLKLIKVFNNVPCSIENELHSLFNKEKIRGEWFNFSERIQKYIKETK